jgi:cell division septation protein DedD
MVNMTGRARVALGLVAAAGLLAGCGEAVQRLGFLGEEERVPAAETRIVERDVEAPEVFRAAEPGLWDGRPSLGGVWVAFPGVRDPERVIIRNPGNDRFVIGALFRRERENPGPRLQVSSDAAAALGMLAGQPVTLEVVALRREEAPPEPPAAPLLDTAETVETEIIAAAPAAGPALAPTVPAAAPAAAATAPPARPAAVASPAAAAAPAGRTLLQIGIFSVEANAERAARQVRGTGAAVAVHREESQGRTFWRVLAGPQPEAAGRTALLEKVRALGYTDAYFVSR